MSAFGYSYRYTCKLTINKHKVKHKNLKSTVISQQKLDVHLCNLCYRLQDLARDIKRRWTVSTVLDPREVFLHTCFQHNSRIHIGGKYSIMSIMCVFTGMDVFYRGNIFPNLGYFRVQHPRLFEDPDR